MFHFKECPRYVMAICTRRVMNLEGTYTVYNVAIIQEVLSLGQQR